MLKRLFDTSDVPFAAPSSSASVLPEISNVDSVTGGATGARACPLPSAPAPATFDDAFADVAAGPVVGIVAVVDVAADVIAGVAAAERKPGSASGAAFVVVGRPSTAAAAGAAACAVASGATARAFFFFSCSAMPSNLSFKSEPCCFTILTSDATSSFKLCTSSRTPGLGGGSIGGSAFAEALPSLESSLSPSTVAAWSSPSTASGLRG